jgi:hypothetical protein
VKNLKFKVFKTISIENNLGHIFAPEILPSCVNAQPPTQGRRYTILSGGGGYEIKYCRLKFNLYRLIISKKKKLREV